MKDREEQDDKLRKEEKVLTKAKEVVMMEERAKGKGMEDEGERVCFFRKKNCN